MKIAQGLKLSCLLFSFSVLNTWAGPPAYGVVTRNVGRIVYEFPNGPVKFLAGQWDSRCGDYQALCDGLSW